MDIVKSLALAVFALGLISRILIWIAGVPLFGANISMAVNERRHLWWKAGEKLLAHQPVITVLGLFFMVLWPAIVFLNIFLLAQLLELFFPGGDRIPFPFVGSYTTFPLIMGMVWVLVQLAFGILFDRSRSIWAKMGLVLIILVSIAAEGFLAYLRARLLISGEEMASPTLWDEIIRKGPILAGFIGIIIPSAEIPTGTIAFKEFIDPLLKAVAHWIGGVLSLIWCAIAWWLFPEVIILPHSMTFLREEFKKVVNGLTRLKVRANALKEEKNRMGDKPKYAAALEDEVNKLETKRKEIDASWNRVCEEIESKIKNIGSSYDLEILKRKEIRNLKTQFKKDVLNMENSSDLVYNEVKEGFKRLGEWIVRVQKCKELLQEIEDGGKGIKTVYERLNQQADEINRYFSDQTSSQAHSQDIPPELVELKKKTMDNSNPSEKDRSLRELYGCIAAINEIKGMGDKMNGINSIVDQTREKIPDLVPPPPTKAQENKISTAVLQIEADIIGSKKEGKHRIGDLRRTLKNRGYQLGMPWYRRLYLCFVLLVLLPFYGGCQKINEVMHKEEKPRFIIVLLDETASFALEERGVKTHFWPEIIPWTGRIIDSLNPGEGFGLIGIDGHGFDTEDIRIDLEVVDENPIKAAIQKRELKKKTSELIMRKDATATDILGALVHAAYLLNKMERKYQGVVVVFSDMLQTARQLSGEASSNFPDGTKGYCFYVNATGKGDWDMLLNRWDHIFKGLNLEVRRPDGMLQFYQRGEMKQAFEIAFGSR